MNVVLIKHSVRRFQMIFKRQLSENIFKQKLTGHSSYDGTSTTYAFALELRQNKHGIKTKGHMFTLLTSSHGNCLFAYHLVLKHLQYNVILSSFCIPIFLWHFLRRLECKRMTRLHFSGDFSEQGDMQKGSFQRMV